MYVCVCVTHIFLCVIIDWVFRLVWALFSAIRPDNCTHRDERQGLKRLDNSKEINRSLTDNLLLYFECSNVFGPDLESTGCVIF